MCEYTCVNWIFTFIVNCNRFRFVKADLRVLLLGVISAANIQVISPGDRLKLTVVVFVCWFRSYRGVTNIIGGTPISTTATGNKRRPAADGTDSEPEIDDPELAVFELSEHLNTDCRCACDPLAYSPAYTTCIAVSCILVINFLAIRSVFCCNYFGYLDLELKMLFKRKETSYKLFIIFMVTSLFFFRRKGTIGLLSYVFYVWNLENQIICYNIGNYHLVSWGETHIGLLINVSYVFYSSYVYYVPYISTVSYVSYEKIRLLYQPPTSSLVGFNPHHYI